MTSRYVILRQAFNIRTQAFNRWKIEVPVGLKLKSAKVPPWENWKVQNVQPEYRKVPQEVFFRYSVSILSNKINANFV